MASHPQVWRGFTLTSVLHHIIMAITIGALMNAHLNSILEMAGGAFAITLVITIGVTLWALIKEATRGDGR